MGSGKDLPTKGEPAETQGQEKKKTFLLLAQ